MGEAAAHGKGDDRVRVYGVRTGGGGGLDARKSPQTGQPGRRSSRLVPEAVFDASDQLRNVLSAGRSCRRRNAHVQFERGT